MKEIFYVCLKVLVSLIVSSGWKVKRKVKKKNFKAHIKNCNTPFETFTYKQEGTNND